MSSIKGRIISLLFLFVLISPAVANAAQEQKIQINFDNINSNDVNIAQHENKRNSQYASSILCNFPASTLTINHANDLDFRCENPAIDISFQVQFSQLKHDYFEIYATSPFNSISGSTEMIIEANGTVMTSSEIENMEHIMTYISPSHTYNITFRHYFDDNPTEIITPRQTEISITDEKLIDGGVDISLTDAKTTGDEDIGLIRTLTNVEPYIDFYFSTPASDHITPVQINKDLSNEFQFVLDIPDDQEWIWLPVIHNGNFDYKEISYTPGYITRNNHISINSTVALPDTLAITVKTDKDFYLYFNNVPGAGIDFTGSSKLNRIYAENIFLYSKPELNNSGHYDEAYYMTSLSDYAPGKIDEYRSMYRNISISIYHEQSSERSQVIRANSNLINRTIRDRVDVENQDRTLTGRISTAIDEFFGGAHRFFKGGITKLIEQVKEKGTELMNYLIGVGSFFLAYFVIMFLSRNSSLILRQMYRRDEEK